MKLSNAFLIAGLMVGGVYSTVLAHSTDGSSVFLQTTMTARACQLHQPELSDKMLAAYQDLISRTKVNWSKNLDNIKEESMNKLFSKTLDKSTCQDYIKALNSGKADAAVIKAFGKHR